MVVLNGSSGKRANKRLHRTNFTVTTFALRGKTAARKIYSVSRALCLREYESTRARERRAERTI